MLPHIQGPPLRLETTSAKEITLSTIARMVSPAMSAEGWSVSIDRSWTVDGTYPCGDELGYHHESTDGIPVYAPTREAEASSPHGPGEPGDAEDGNGGEDAPGDDQNQEE